MGQSVAGPDYIVQIGSARPSPPPRASAPKRPWLAVHWRCCRTYSRIYRNRDGSAYEGRCPVCGAPVRASIGEGGTGARFFEAG